MSSLKERRKHMMGIDIETRVTKVQINDWSNPREMKVGRRWIHLQVTTSDCESDCHRCKERVAEFKKALNRKPILHSWTMRYGKNGGCWVRVLKVKDGDQLGFLKKIFNLKSICYYTGPVVSQSA
jgi:hypothetical protein